MIDQVDPASSECGSTVPVENSSDEGNSGPGLSGHNEALIRPGLSGHVDDLPDMIPVRMLNEFTYCPRLGFLEWVDGEWSENLETMEGSFGHRRVDRPSTKHVAKPEDKTTEKATARDAELDPVAIHTRSLMLSAPTEGLLAKLDVLELEGIVATPVDYKRGKVPNIPEGAYEPERVQLCAQGLILRANGFQCDRGVLYFIASKKRVTIEFTDELIARTRFLRDEFRRTAAAGEIPPPLIDSPKCPRCSLVGICLPDETNLLQLETRQLEVGEQWTSARGQRTSDSTPLPRIGGEGQGEGAVTDDVPVPRVRRLIPANDDALPLYVQTQGAMIGKTGDRLTVKLKDELLAERRLMDVSQVSVFGSVMFSAQGLRELTTRGIPICHLTYGGWFHAITSGLIHKNVELRIRQYAIAADPQRSLQIARWFISGKIRNCRTLLRRHLNSSSSSSSANTDAQDWEGEAPAEPLAGFSENRTPNTENSHGRMTNVECQMTNELQDESTRPLPLSEHQNSNNENRVRDSLLANLAEYRRRAERATSAETLLGLEGMAAKIYFEHFFDLLNRRHEFNVNDRNRRPPRDPVNAVLSFVYALLVKELTVVLQAVGFDPMLGFLHRPRYGRPSLALDVAEEYRPLIGDSVTMMVFNNGEVDHDSFLERAGAVTLTEAGRRAVLAAFERRMQQEVTHPIFGYRISYRRILEVQARLLARAVTGELPEYIPFCTR